ncbi:hypothetical protein B7494_g7571 [Chlorociboria aeruginascens]|nr:hypothetical protein B7494_g7571 [Chlorociboria aeruginascens]
MKTPTTSAFDIESHAFIMDLEGDQTSQAQETPGCPLRPPRKRRRIIISCTECHRRKQKCDRGSPCANCVTRKKQSECHYENEAARKQQLLDESIERLSESPQAVVKVKSDSAAQVTALGYSKLNGNHNTTLGIVKKIENYGVGPYEVIASPASNGNQGGLREKYKSLIRQLPSKPYIEKLLDTYFYEVNNYYYSLDEGIFRDHLRDWNNLSFSTLNRGPQELPPDLQFFPALLFQTLALALQFQPTDYDPDLDSLKYAAGMSFEDLAADYSESGMAVLTLLGKRHTTLVAVQAGFLRTSYLKNCGMVTEAWHSLSQCIRDAQEIGLHKIEVDRRPRKSEEVLENLWLEQLKRRMWTILSLWDIHIAIALGRPTTIDSRDRQLPLPIDVPIPENRREIAPAPRLESDPPTPLSALLWTAEIAAPLWDIHNLEKEGPHPADSSKVEKMHNLIEQISLHCPPPFRAHNPDRTFDSHPACRWLSLVRPGFQNTKAFTLMALHRPYIFHNAASRTSALKAGLDILRAQREIFSLVNSKHYKFYGLVLSTFDAIVVVAAIYIIHPLENREYLSDSLQHYEWAMERFQKLSARSSMAKVALGVLKAIHVRLKRALGKIYPLAPSPPHSTSTLSSATSPAAYPEPPNQYSPSIASRSHSQYNMPTISNLTTTPDSSTGWESFTGPPIVPSNFDFSSMTPLQPMHDLLFNDLSTFTSARLANTEPEILNSSVLDSNEANGDPAAAWQFEGDFGSDSFWGFMNNYTP